MARKRHSAFQRPEAAELARRLSESRRHLQVVLGPRQVGKTTLVQQVIEQLQRSVRFISADEPTLRDAAGSST
ncbi:MAG: ATP-binding protein [Planctomycetota bacterium]|nr:MAG: ATP-binding protein [Planctomycetota bacterium]